MGTVPVRPGGFCETIEKLVFIVFLCCCRKLVFDNNNLFFPIKMFFDFFAEVYTTPTERTHHPNSARVRSVEVVWLFALLWPWGRPVWPPDQRGSLALFGSVCGENS